MAKTIMIVDDSSTMLMSLRNSLEIAGFKVLAANDGQPALDQLLGGAKPDLIITDIRMPGKNGIELITQIMGLRKDIPIIINSAYQSHKEDFMTWAADAYVVKSSSLDELKLKIKELIGE